MWLGWWLTSLGAPATRLPQMVCGRPRRASANKLVRAADRVRAGLRCRKCSEPCNPTGRHRELLLAPCHLHGFRRGPSLGSVDTPEVYDRTASWPFLRPLGRHSYASGIRAEHGSADRPRGQPAAVDKQRCQERLAPDDNVCDASKHPESLHDPCEKKSHDPCEKKRDPGSVG